MEYVESGREALEVMAKTSIDVVVTDYRMPEMDGGQLLKEVKERHPETIRIILSGQADQRTFIDGISAMHQFTD